MDKLTEISKIFNVSVDELLNDSEIETKVNETIEDRPIQDKNTKSNKGVIIIVTVLIVIIVGTIGMFAMPFIIGNKIISDVSDVFSNQGVEQEATGFFGKIFGLLNKAIDQQEDVLENLDNSDEESDIVNLFGEAVNEIGKSDFNSKFEFYNGSKSGTQLKRLLDEINTNNKKENRKITVKYNEVETQDTTEIKNLKMELNDSDKFEISFEYDKNGYIYEVAIEKYENNSVKNEITNEVTNEVHEQTNKVHEEINNTNEQIINQNNEVFNQMNQFMNDAMNKFNN